MSEQQSSGPLTPDGVRAPSAESSSSKAKRSTVRVACNACRAKKIKCDGQRPTCGWCASHPGVLCVYDTGSSDETRSAALRRENETLKRDLQHIQGLLQPLLSLPEDQSIDFLKRLRQARRMSTGPFAGEGGATAFVGMSDGAPGPQVDGEARGPPSTHYMDHERQMPAPSSSRDLDPRAEGYRYQ